MPRLSTQMERHNIDKHLLELNICDKKKKKKTAADESLREGDKMADIIVNQ